MYLYSKSKIEKEIIIRIYDDGATLTKTPVKVDKEDNTSQIISVYKDIENILSNNGFIAKSIETIMDIIKSETKTVETKFKTVRISEGDIVDITYIENGNIHNIRGALNKIIESPLRHRYFDSNKSDYVKIFLVLDASTEFNRCKTEVSLDNIRDIEIIKKNTEDPFGDEYPKYLDESEAIVNSSEAITEILNEETKTTLLFAAGTFKEKLTVSKSVTLKGNYADVPANEGYRCTDEISPDETIINGIVTIEGESDVVLDGFTFTDKSNFCLYNKGSLIIKNCKFVNITPYQLKSFLITGISTKEETDSVLLIIENCYFGNNKSSQVDPYEIVRETYSYYNGFELNCRLANGSNISRNYFAKDVCTNNIINIYNVEEGANILISKNHFEFSGNAIRIGIKGEPKCNIVCSDNIYDNTHENSEYAGLLLIQPYGMLTTSFANCTIVLNNTIHNDDLQLYYLYAGSKDMQFTKDNKPTVVVL